MSVLARQGLLLRTAFSYFHHNGNIDLQQISKLAQLDLPNSTPEHEAGLALFETDR